MHIERKKARLRSSGGNRAKHLDPVAEYIAGNATVSDISKRAGISAGALTTRIKKLGIPLRGRGRNLMEHPTDVQKQIIAATAKQTYEQVGSAFGISKQRVSTIVRRWSSVALGAEISRNDNRKLHVISFRVDQKVLKRLQKELQNRHFRNLRSPNELARELLTIFLGENRVL